MGQNHTPCSGPVRLRDALGHAVRGSIALLALPTLLSAQMRQRFKTLLWVDLDGGQSDFEGWNPKPDAPYGIRSSFSAIQTSVPGFLVSALYPRIAQLLSKTVLLRACHTEGSLDHLPSMKKMVGRKTPNGEHLLSEHARRAGGVPPVYMQVPHAINALDYRNLAFAASSHMIDMPWSRDSERYLVPAFGRVDAVMTRRTALLRELDRLNLRGTNAYQEHRANALALMGRGINIDLQDDEIIRYGGRNPTSIGILTMREIARAGITGALIFRSDDFDSHVQIARDMSVRGPRMDQALAALLEDAESGVLPDDTLIVCSGEFGRTPRINSFGGRDHHPWHTTLLWGNGLQRGAVHGKTDRRGEEGIDGVVETAGLHALIRQTIGMPPDPDVRANIPPVLTSMANVQR